MESNQEKYHHVFVKPVYARLILPIAIPKLYTYWVPEEWSDQVEVGMRVEVQFGKNKLYAALVADLSEDPPVGYKAKPVLSVIDKHPIVQPIHIRFWKWIADYYCCTLGEVMNAALPAGLKLASETRVVISPLFENNYQSLSDDEYLIAEALSIQSELSIDDVRKILDKKTVYPLIRRLLDKKMIYLKEELRERYKPKSIDCVRLQEPYASDRDQLQGAFDLLKNAPKQVEALMAFLQIERQKPYVRKQDVYRAANTGASVLNGLEKKAIVEIYPRDVSRLTNYEDDLQELTTLSDQQVQALGEVQKSFEDKSVVLLHGITGSGKTRLYIELIQKVIQAGGQVLYLLPEIALSAQITNRLKKFFGDDIRVYHSRLNNHERVEMWQTTQQGLPIILGARSSLFLPFKNLQLIIVDEEHDPSFKQMDPAPRYHARDTAIFLAHSFGAKTLLGTATPAIESYQNALQGKYGLVKMTERFGGMALPALKMINIQEAMKVKKMHNHFSGQLIDQLKEILAANEQAILFQNRRGYSPVINCPTCGWHSECIHCDVSLTYHKFSNHLRCHYCGYQASIPEACPACGETQLNLKGFGTEKIEDELKLILPEARIRRMDHDTVKGKYSFDKIISAFEEGEFDILIGTQMVTKGLDFDNVSLVSILSADQLLRFPDFRASERAFQLITQVSGRSGRKHKQGLVLIQAYNPAHPVLLEVMDNNYSGFFRRELAERHTFQYPPFTRLIKITIRHKAPRILNEAAIEYAKLTKSRLGDRIIGPAPPSVARVRGYYLLTMMVKLEKNNKVITNAKKILLEAVKVVGKMSGFSSVRFTIDVDPY